MKVHFLPLIGIIILIFVRSFNAVTAARIILNNKQSSKRDVNLERNSLTNQRILDDDYDEDDNIENEDSGDDSDEDSYEENDDEDSKNTGPIVPEPIQESNDDPNNPHINFASGSEEEHLHNFKRISEDLKLFEDEYIACVDAITDDDFSEETVENCLGKDFIKLQLDIKYETMKVMSRAEDKLRHFFIYSCYIPVGDDEIKSLACDLLQKDMLDALWNCMEFLELAETNKVKYLEEYAKMDNDLFTNITVNLTELHKHFFELIEEIDAHKQLTIFKIKNHIDDKTKLIIKQTERDQRHLKQPTYVTHTIKIQEKVKDPNFIITNSLPTVGVLSDGSPDPNFTLYTKNPNFIGMDSRGEKNNSLRMLGSSNGYEGLNSIHREDSKIVRRTGASMRDNYRSTVNRLKTNLRVQPIAFRNTHVTSLGNLKRFK